MLSTTARINAFAGAIAVAARDAGKFSPVLLDQMPNFENDPEFKGRSGEFALDRAISLAGSLPHGSCWSHIHKIIRDEIQGCILLHPEDAIGPSIGSDGSIHCPEGVDPSDVYFSI